MGKFSAALFFFFLFIQIYIFFCSSFLFLFLSLFLFSHLICWTTLKEMLEQEMSTFVSETLQFSLPSHQLVRFLYIFLLFFCFVVAVVRCRCRRRRRRRHHRCCSHRRCCRYRCRLFCYLFVRITYVNGKYSLFLFCRLYFNIEWNDKRKPRQWNVFGCTFFVDYSRGISIHTSCVYVCLCVRERE